MTIVGSDNFPLRDQILKANFQFYPQLFTNISDEAKDLINKLLKVKPSERLSADQILQHPWMKNERARTQVRLLVNEYANKIKKNNQDEEAAKFTILQPIIFSQGSKYKNTKIFFLEN